jgi:hypothetical protein
MRFIREMADKFTQWSNKRAERTKKSMAKLTEASLSKDDKGHTTHPAAGVSSPSARINRPPSVTGSILSFQSVHDLEERVQNLESGLSEVKDSLQEVLKQQQSILELLLSKGENK